MIMDGNTTTPHGSARFDIQNRGPMRPGKTERDHRSGAWQQRLSNRAMRAELHKRRQMLADNGGSFKERAELVDRMQAISRGEHHS